MANTVDIDFNLILSGGLRDSSGSPRATTRRTISKAFDSAGANASLVNQMYFPQAVLTLGAGANTTLDLTSGLLNPINLEITGASDFAKVRVIVIEHDTTSAASAIVVGNGTNPFGGLLTTNTNTFTLKPGQGVAMWDRYSTTGMTVDGSNKTVKITNSDGVNTASYYVYVLGSI